jgi:hypothetical protein
MTGGKYSVTENGEIRFIYSNDVWVMTKAKEHKMIAAETKAVATKGYATHGPDAKFAPFEFTRREVGANDILLDVAYCGICHTDIHQARAEWEPMIPSVYPMVPGHEIVGRISQVGADVPNSQSVISPGSAASSTHAANVSPARADSNSTA